MAYDELAPGHRAPWLWQAALVAILTLASVRPSLAGETALEPKQEAKVHFRAGQNHYNLNEFSEALVEFKEAYRLYPDPVFLFNLGQCERQLGHLEDASRFYRSYLREQPKAPNRQEVLRKLDEIDEALKNKPADGNKAVTPVPVTPPTPLAPAAAPPSTTTSAGAPPETFPTQPPANAVSPGDTPDRIDLTSTGPQQPEAGPAPIYKRWWFWTAVAVVAVGAGVGIYAATAGGEASAPATGLGSKGVF